MYFGLMPFACELGDGGLERVGAQALLVQRHADELGSVPREAGDRAAVARLLHEDGVARRHQHLVDQVEGLVRARGDQDLVRAAGDARLLVQLLAEELAQADVAERAAVEAVGGERRPLALQHGCGRGDQSVDRRGRRIVVAADEVERREAGVFDGSRRQARAKEGREVEGRGGHECSPMWISRVGRIPAADHSAPALRKQARGHAD